MIGEQEFKKLKTKTDWGRDWDLSFTITMYYIYIKGFLWPQTEFFITIIIRQQYVGICGS
jgi:hypothetical protein